MTGPEAIIEKLEQRRAYSANDAIIMQTEIGKALARGRAYAFNEAIKIVRAQFGITEPRIADEYAEGGRY